MPWEGWYSLSPQGRGLGRGAWSRIHGWVELSFPWAASSAGERLPHTQEVVGSNPTPPTTSSVAPSSSGLGRSPLKAETAGSNPAGATKLTQFELVSERMDAKRSRYSVRLISRS